MDRFIVHLVRGREGAVRPAESCRVGRGRSICRSVPSFPDCKPNLESGREKRVIKNGQLVSSGDPLSSVQCVSFLPVTCRDGGLYHKTKDEMFLERRLCPILGMSCSNTHMQVLESKIFILIF